MRTTFFGLQLWCGNAMSVPPLVPKTSFSYHDGLQTHQVSQNKPSFPSVTYVVYLSEVAKPTHTHTQTIIKELDKLLYQQYSMTWVSLWKRSKKTLWYRTREGYHS